MSSSLRDVFLPLTDQELGALSSHLSMDSHRYKHFVAQEHVEFTVLDVLNTFTPEGHAQVQRHDCNNANATAVLGKVNPDTRCRIVSIGGGATTLPLNITFTQMSQMFVQYAIEEEFWEVVRCFGSAPHPAEGGCTHAFARAYPDRSQSICYDLQYMDENNRGGQNPWSQRHTGIYHRRLLRDNRPFDFIVVLHPSEDTKLESTLLNLNSNLNSDRMLARRIHSDPSTVHEILLETYLKIWRWYLRAQGDVFKNRNDELFTMDEDITSVDTQLLGIKTVLGFRNLRDQILTAAAFCKGNQAVIDLLISIHKQVDSTFQTNSAAIKERVRGYINGLDALQNRIDNSIALLEYSLGVRHQELATTMNKHMEELTHSTVDDSATVRNITKLGLFYLPPTFICGLFGMNFFNFDDNSGELVIAPNFWIFVVLSVALTGATWGLYQWSDPKLEGQMTEAERARRAAASGEPSMGRRHMRRKGVSDTFDSKTTASTGKSSILPK